MPFRPDSQQVVLFGNGTGTRCWLSRFGSDDEDYLIVDNDVRLHGTSEGGILILSPATLQEVDFSRIIVCLTQVHAVLSQLQGLGVPFESIVIPPKPDFRPQPLANEEGRREALRALGLIQKALLAAGIVVVVEDGALLGIARDGDLIPWDHDIDLASPSEAGHLTHVLQELEEMGSIQSLELEHWSLDGFPGVSAVFFVGLCQCPFAIQSRIVRGKNSFTRFSSDPSGFRLVPTALIYPPQSRSVSESGTLLLPNDVDGYLQHNYGDSWATPNRAFTYRDYAYRRPPEGKLR